MRTLTLALLCAGCLPRYHRDAPLPALQVTPVEIGGAALPYRWVDVDGVRVAYVDTGGDGPVALLVHGLSSWGDFWSYQVEPLSRTHRVIVVDLPGYGASDRPDAPYTMRWYADVLRGLLDALDVDRCVYVGHSMGGQIGLTFALEWPERLSSLVLSAPAGLETFSRGHGQWMKDYWHERRALEAREVDSRRSFTGLVFADRDDHLEWLLAERVRQGEAPDFEGTSVAVSRSIAGMVDGPVYDRLGDVVVPTLIVFGTNDALIPNPIFNGGRTVDVARRGHDAIPGSELVMIPGAGHTVHHDAPEAFNAAILDFLSRHPESP
jgi:pimeloyl-ACP methyl ester carboxylesterase